MSVGRSQMLIQLSKTHLGKVPDRILRFGEAHLRSLFGPQERLCVGLG